MTLTLYRTVSFKYYDSGSASNLNKRFFLSGFPGEICAKAVSIGLVSLFSKP